jgi:hypothetical protein
MTRLLRRYAVALTYLVLVALAEIIMASLPSGSRARFRLWASTNVANLHHHPIPALVVSAFLPTASQVGPQLAWLALIALAMFGANRAIGNLRLASICVAGQVIGTLVSEGIVNYRIDHGKLPQSWAHILDIGPSYVVVSAVVVAVAFGTWLARVAALAALASLVFIGDIFAGLGQLHVAAAGHVTAIVVAAIGCAALGHGRPRSSSKPHDDGIIDADA